MVDKVSSHLWARITPDKTFTSARSCMEEYFHTCSLCYSIQSDGGPAFRNAWQSWLSSIHVSHHLTSPYHSSSNGLAERNLAKLKNTLLKLGKVTKETLQKVVYKFNCLEHQDGSLSPNSKFCLVGFVHTCQILSQRKWIGGLWWNSVRMCRKG